MVKTEIVFATVTEMKKNKIKIGSLLTACVGLVIKRTEIISIILSQQGAAKCELRKFFENDEVKIFFLELIYFTL